jgi:ABC-2 type transport system permease protein
MTTAPAPSPPTEVEQILQVTLAANDRPPRPSVMATVRAFAWRALLRIRHIPEQLMDVTVFPVMMLLMFTFLFGGAVAGSTGAYLQDVLPGITVMQVTWISMYTGHNLNRDLARGVHDRFRSLPIWRPATLVGPLVADAVRYALATAIILGLGVALGFRPGAGLTGVAAGLGVLLVCSHSACRGSGWWWESSCGQRTRCSRQGP